MSVSGGAREFTERESYLTRCTGMACINRIHRRHHTHLTLHERNSRQHHPRSPQHAEGREDQRSQFVKRHTFS